MVLGKTTAAYELKHCNQLSKSGISRWLDQGTWFTSFPAALLLSASTLSFNSSAISTYSPLMCASQSLWPQSAIPVPPVPQPAAPVPPVPQPATPVSQLPHLSLSLSHLSCQLSTPVPPGPQPSTPVLSAFHTSPQHETNGRQLSTSGAPSWSALVLPHLPVHYHVAIKFEETLQYNL